MAAIRKYFGTDGIRGVASVPPLDPETLVRLGKAVASIFLRTPGRHRIIIGKDTRLSGYMIENSLTAGITSMGADVLLVGPVPTPGLAYLTWSMRTSAGIMISASHNTFEDNGIKIFGTDGYKLPDSMEEELEKLLEPGVLDGKTASPEGLGKASRVSDAIGRYTVFLKEQFPRDLSMEGLKIALDCANGAAYAVAPQTLTELGADVYSRGISPNGRNINAGVGSLYPEVVAKLVKEQSLEIGLALDGDGDRAILVDEKGNILDGDMILAICALDLKKRGLLPKGKIISTVMSNLGLERLLRANGIEVERTQVGDRNVLQRMRELDIHLGGEQSGHTIFSDIATSGDGILTAIMVIGVMMRTGKTLSQLNASFEAYPQKLLSLKVNSKPPLDSIEPLSQAIKLKERELGRDGRILVRYSGTEYKIRIMVEAKSDALCQKHVGDLSALVRKHLGGVESV